MDRQEVQRIRRVGIAVAAGAIVAILLKAVGFPAPSSESTNILDPSQVAVVRTPGGLLEVATLVKVEEFGWQTTFTCPLLDCGTLLGATITRVRVPVHYTYRIPLSPEWELEPGAGGHVLVVPPLEAAKPAAVETAKLEIETRSEWTSPGRELNAQIALRELGPEMDRRASRDAYVEMQKPFAAKTVEEFARKWLREQGKPAPAQLRVVFKPGAP